jgi:V/A-type H+-transporting ATPase subunit K
MSMLVKVMLVAALVLSIVVPFGAYFLGEKSRKRYKTSLACNCFFFFSTLVLASILAYGGNVHAAETAGAAGNPGLATGLGYIAAALVTSVSGIGSGIAVASSASAALGAISEDQSVFGKSMIFVAMAEGIALYGLIISFMILGKL